MTELTVAHSLASPQGRPTGYLRLLFAGSRGLTDRDLVFPALAEIAGRHGYRLTVVHGHCPAGGDHLVHEWARAHQHLGVLEEKHPADWDSCTWLCPQTAHRRRKLPGDRVHPGILNDYCPGAGPRRNARMVGLGAHLMLAAPVGPSYGTRGCMSLARARGITVTRLEDVIA
jgi:hypothetical protein